MSDYYKILEINEMASQREIKNAFRRLALVYHPDKNPGNLEAKKQFLLINEAYQVLSDPLKKSQYDNRNSDQYIEQEEHYTRPYPPPFTQKRGEKGSYFDQTYTKENLKRNFIANIYALGIVSIIFIIVFAIHLFIKKQEEKEANARIAYQGEFIHQLTDLASNNDFEAAALKLDKEFNDTMNTFGDKQLLKRLNNDLVAAIESRALQFEVNNLNDEALKLLGIAYKMKDHKSADFYKRIGYVSRKVGNYEEAIKAFQNVLNLEDSEFEANMNIASIYNYDLEQFDQALPYYEASRQLAIKEYIGLFGKGYALALKPEKLSHNHLSLFLGMALAHLKVGQYQLADERLEWAAQLAPNNAVIQYLYGELFFAMGKNHQACASWKKAVNLGNKESIMRLQDVCNR